MKTIKSIILITLALFNFACNNDDALEEEVLVIPEPTVEELLVDFSPWTFTNYEVLEIISTTDQTITDIEINEYTTELLTGFTMDFKSDGMVVINHPLSGELERTWAIFNDDILFDTDSSTPQIWKNIEITEESLSIESELFSIFEESFTIVEHYGQLYFE